MFDQRYYNRPNYPFTASQWQELEHQVLAFRYLISGLSVPPDLMSSVIRSPSNPSSPSLFPQLQPLPGWGCFQVGYGRKVDTEPGRCRRTDGKKWRCSKEAHTDSRYCEKHMHRSKSKAKKQLEALNSSSNTNNNTNSPSKPLNTTFKSSFPYPAVSHSHDNVLSYPKQTQASNFYPFLSPQSSSTDQDNNSAHWLLDSELYDEPHKKDIRYSYEMKGEATERVLGSEDSKFSLTSSSRCSDLIFQDTGYNVDENHKKLGVGMDQEHETQNLFPQFLGDWPLKLKSSQAVGVYSTSK